MCDHAITIGSLVAACSPSVNRPKTSLARDRIVIQHRHHSQSVPRPRLLRIFFQHSLERMLPPRGDFSPPVRCSPFGKSAMRRWSFGTVVTGCIARFAAQSSSLLTDSFPFAGRWRIVRHPNVRSVSARSHQSPGPGPENTVFIEGSDFS